jgi:hypothetical protein
MNATGVAANRNIVFDNTTGLVVGVLSGWAGAASTNNSLRDNYVFANNLINSSRVGSWPSFLIQGTGIAVVGADQTIVVGNFVSNNASLGIAVTGLDSIFQNLGQHASSTFDQQHQGNNNNISSNWAEVNGFHAMSPLLSTGADLYWDGLGTGNTWRNNAYYLTFNLV